MKGILFVGIARASLRTFFTSLFRSLILIDHIQVILIVAVVVVKPKARRWATRWLLRRPSACARALSSGTWREGVRLALLQGLERDEILYNNLVLIWLHTEQSKFDYLNEKMSETLTYVI